MSSNVVSEHCATIISHMMMPQHANSAGNVHGGVVMKYIDEAAFVVASRHARCNTVTASLDRLDFHRPVKIGDLLVLKACINYTGSTSMEIGVRVEAEHLRSGKIIHIASSYLTFVALDDEGHPTKVPQLELVNEEAKRRYQDALVRRKNRLEPAG